MKKLILITLSICVVCGCAGVNSKAPSISSTPVEITGSQFANYQLSFVSSGNFENYTFSEDGESVICSRGNGDESLGLVYDWKIVNGNTIELHAKKGINARVNKIRVIEGYPFLSQVGEIEYTEMNASLKTVRFKFREVTDKRAVTMDGRVFKKEKY